MFEVVPSRSFISINDLFHRPEENSVIEIVSDEALIEKIVHEVQPDYSKEQEEGRENEPDISSTSE